MHSIAELCFRNKLICKPSLSDPSPPSWLLGEATGARPRARGADPARPTAARNRPWGGGIRK